MPRQYAREPLSSDEGTRLIQACDTLRERQVILLGLVPREHSTGGKPRLLGVSRRGNIYLRKWLVHGARATLR
jgi:transposase